MSVYYMVVFCLMAAVAIAEITQEVRDGFMAMQHECMAETGATEEMIMGAMQGDFPDNPEFKEQLVCVGRKSGAIDADGSYNKDILKKKMMTFFENEEKVDALLDECLITKSTPQETSFDMAKCTYMKYKGN